jgi:hypothetical protein
MPLWADDDSRRSQWWRYAFKSWLSYYSVAVVQEIQIDGFTIAGTSEFGVSVLVLGIIKPHSLLLELPMFGFHASKVRFRSPTGRRSALNFQPSRVSSSILRTHYSLMFDGISYHRSAHNLYIEKVYDVAA